jgi:starch synthase (maltosyl-transferring)
MDATAPPRVVVENVRPRVDDGRYPVKRTAGETLEVLADVFSDGHDVLAVMLRQRVVGSEAWAETPMESLDNDLWSAEIMLERLGVYEYAVIGWVDRFGSWRAELATKTAAGLDVESELLEGAALLRQAATRASARARSLLKRQAVLIAGDGEQDARVRAALTPELAAAVAAVDDRRGAVESPILRVRVDRERARVGAWYEMFPRSASGDPSRSATLREAAARLADVAAMGFDVLYLPPIHPIGVTHRKGPNNALVAAPEDPGSPWAIGSASGGHTAVDPALGTLADFDAFVAAARAHGLEVALDLAFQCSPDHPWVREHPEWFRLRPDGTIKYAENPPNTFEDIHFFEFDGAASRALWDALRDVVLFWVERGVRILRVDNPHTKPLRFWEWMIADVQRVHPDVIFLAEAFTRPKVMKHLSKGGFTQSYTYFTWRNTKAEIVEYFTELTQTEVREYLRPNLFANTPDVVHEYLQTGGRAAFQIRLILAATLGATYGIYGPPFELCVGDAIPGTEEYLDSEKYQVRAWDHDRSGNIRELVTLVNRARHEQRALQFDRNLRFHDASDDRLLVYSKTTDDLESVVLVAVNLDPHRPADGWVRLALDELGLDGGSFQVQDLLTDARYDWRGERNYVRLDPAVMPAHLFVVRRWDA